MASVESEATDAEAAIIERMVSMGISDETADDLMSLAMFQPALRRVLKVLLLENARGEKSPAELLAVALCQHTAIHAQVTRGH